MKAATLFSGGEGVGCGLKAAGIDHAWGVEYDDKIAQVARDNGFNVLTADILDCDPNDFESPDILWASTVCVNGSSANAQGRGETELDYRLGVKTADFIQHLQPRFFILENVWLYRTFEAFAEILNTLARGGYFYHFEHVDASMFGVPQTRTRLILRAAKGQLLRPLQPTVEKTVGWGSVCPPATNKSKLTKDQQQWTKDFPRPFIIDTQNRRQHRENSRYTVRQPHEPAMTITASGFARIKVVNGDVKKWGAEQVKAVQTFPDWYGLPDDSRLAQRIVGNAVPPLMVRRLVEQLL